MRNKILIALVSLLLTVNTLALAVEQTATAEKPVNSVASVAKAVDSLTLVNSPKQFLNQEIKIKADFDKFTTLGLDYKPAFRDSQKYISFMIKRSDTVSNTISDSIPLPELKLFIEREKAEKLIDLETGDKIEFTGKVFSTALGDPWVEVDNVTVLSSKSKKLSAKK